MRVFIIHSQNLGMKRIQLFEFEDFAWFPNWIRNAITSLIIILNKQMGVEEVLSNQISSILKDLKTNSIVDIGSGSGGSMPAVYKMLKHQNTDVKLMMTDRYPNADAIKHFSSLNDSSLNYFSRPLDATTLEYTPEGLKTMVNCFHHMPPKVAKQILHSAQKNKQPLLVYELSDNKMPTIIWWLFLPLSLLILFIMVLFMTPFVRPLTFKQLFFTYIIPIIPLFYAWDGQASMPRTYSLNDYEELLPKQSNEYTWEKGYAKNNKGKNSGTYLLGKPKR